MKWLRQHVSYWGENYFALPLVVAALVASIVLVNWLTGRAPMDDVGAIVGCLVDALRLCVILTLTGLAQHFLYGYRGGNPRAMLADDVLDSCVTCFLLLLFSVLIFGLIR